MQPKGIELKFNHLCPGCGKNPVKLKEGQPTAVNFYLDSRGNVLKMTCQRCKAMLDLNMPKEQFDAIMEVFKDSIVPLN